MCRGIRRGADRNIIQMTLLPAFLLLLLPPPPPPRRSLSKPDTWPQPDGRLEFSTFLFRPSGVSAFADQTSHSEGLECRRRQWKGPPLNPAHPRGLRVHSGASWSCCDVSCARPGNSHQMHREWRRGTPERMILPSLPSLFSRGCQDGRDGTWECSEFHSSVPGPRSPLDLVGFGLHADLEGPPTVGTGSVTAFGRVGVSFQ